MFRTNSAHADEFDDLVNSMMSQGYFNCALNEISSTYVTVACPVQSNSGAAINQYKVVISTGSQSAANFANVTGKLYTGVLASNGMVKFTVEGLSSTTKYYLTLVALNAASTMINNGFSNELSFIIADEMKKAVTTPSSGTSTTTTPGTPSDPSNTQMHNAGGTNMSQALGNIRPIQNGNRVRINFTPNGSAATVEFLLRHSSETSFRSIANIPLNQGYVEFDVTRGGTYILRALPRNSVGTKDGTEFRQTIVLEPVTGQPAEVPTTTTTTTTRINVTDKTGPAENIFAIILLAGLTYGRYRYKKQVL